MLMLHCEQTDSFCVFALFQKDESFTISSCGLHDEDNEMMVPFCIGDAHSAPGCNVLPGR
jgi:hypothetical protein